MFQFTAIVNQNMPSTKKILITTETHEHFILRMVGGKRAFGFCPGCGHEVEMLTIDRAVSLCSVKTAELVRRSEACEIHSMETDSGHLLFCKDSIEHAAGRREE